MREQLRAFGLSDTNTPINKDRLLYALCVSSGSNAEEIYKVLQDNPDRDKDKRSIMRKTGRESSIDSTTGQGLGSVIDNISYYVDSCAWWIKGWDIKKYTTGRELEHKRFIQDIVGMDNINPRTGLVRTRRKQIPRRIRGR